MKRFLLAVFTVFLCGCGVFTVGKGEFSCPHVRSHVYCMPPSEIEKLDRKGLFDWRWRPLSKDAESATYCSLNNLLLYMDLCRKPELSNTKVCREFERRCLNHQSIVRYHGRVYPVTDAPVEVQP